MRIFETCSNSRIRPKLNESFLKKWKKEYKAKIEMDERIDDLYSEWAGYVTQVEIPSTVTNLKGFLKSEGLSTSVINAAVKDLGLQPDQTLNKKDVKKFFRRTVQQDIMRQRKQKDKPQPTQTTNQPTSQPSQPSQPTSTPSIPSATSVPPVTSASSTTPVPAKSNITSQDAMNLLKTKLSDEELAKFTAEFLKSIGAARNVKESSSAGSTSSGNIASVAKPFFSMQRRVPRKKSKKY